MMNYRMIATLSLALIVPASVVLVGCASKSNAAAKGQKGGGAKGAAAKTSGQKTGGTAVGAKDKAQAKGSTDEGVTCDESLEGVAWCASEGSVVFCQGGTFYELACADVGGDVCSDDPSTHVIDCVPAADAE